MGKMYNPKGKRAPLTDKDMDTFPINLFFKVFHDFDKEKFDRTYTDNMMIFFDIYKENIGFLALYRTMHDKKTFAEISKQWSINLVKISDEMNKALKCITNNKDVVFSGFKNSKLRNKVITKLMQETPGINKSIAAYLVDARLYSAQDIMDLKSGTEFITAISRSMTDPNVVGRVFSETLTVMNKCGYDTSKFGYTGTETKKKYVENHNKAYPTYTMNSEVNNIVGYSYNGFSTTTFKVKCPNCGGFFRIHITGHINEEGKLEIEHTASTDNDVWHCENCMRQIKVDKVSKFLKNYLPQDI